MNGSHESSQANAMKESEEFYTYSLIQSYGTMTLDESKLELSSEFLHDVRSAVEKPAGEGTSALKALFKIYGHVIATRVLLGGKLVQTTRSDGASQVFGALYLFH